jgi:ribose transport system permease protein
MKGEIAAKHNVSLARIPIFFWPYVAVVLLFAGGSLISAEFGGLEHIFLVLGLASFTGLVAVGQTMVILLGGIDLSVSSTITMAGVISATIMTGSDTRIIPAVAVSLLIGVVIGLVNGMGIGMLNIPPLVMTLGVTSLVQGISLLYTNGAPKGNSAPFLSDLATGTVAGVPFMVIIWGVVSLIVIMVLHRTSFGRWTYAVGYSPKAAHMSGVNVKLTTVSVYAISGLMAALTGVLLTGYTKTSYLNIGDPYQMASIAAVVVGGTSILGGFGSYIGTIAGTIIITIVQSLLPILSIPEAGRQVVSGSIILVLLLIYGRAKTNR